MDISMAAIMSIVALLAVVIISCINEDLNVGYLAIGFAAFSASWMNDSGFWVVSRLSGLTEKETLQTFSVMLTLVSAVGLVVTLLASKLMPLSS